jgi:hypothetical protein
LVQKLPQQATQQAKAGHGKFDQAMNRGADHQAHVQQVQEINQVDKVSQAQKLGPVDKVHESLKAKSASEQETNLTGQGMDPITQKSGVNKSTSMVMSMMTNMEKGQVAIDKLINGGLMGRNFSNSELLSLQAGMYKYTQELDLCSKVVEKATSGLKDTMKTQV